MDTRNIDFGPAVQPVKGTLTILGDTVVLPIKGAEWASVKFTMAGGSGNSLTAEFSNDGGVNFVAAPYSKRLDQVTSNPTELAVAGQAVASGSTWETPLPANCTHFRLRVSTGGGSAQTATITAGYPYTPGMPVTAVLNDQVTATNTALDTGTLDTSGWSIVLHDFTMNGGTPAFSIQEVDDAGTTLANLVTSAVAFTGGIGPGVTIGGTAGLVPATASIPLPRRMRYQSAAIVGQTSRIRLVARR
jgi:hypothetical protein